MHRYYLTETLAKNTGPLVTALYCIVMARERISSGAQEPTCTNHEHIVLQQYLQHAEPKILKSVPKLYSIGVVAASGDTVATSTSSHNLCRQGSWQTF